MCGDVGDDAGGDGGGEAQAHTARRARDSSKSCKHEMAIRIRVTENVHTLEHRANAT